MPKSVYIKVMRAAPTHSEVVSSKKRFAVLAALLAILASSLLVAAGAHDHEEAEGEDHPPGGRACFHCILASGPDDEPIHQDNGPGLNQGPEWLMCVSSWVPTGAFVAATVATDAIRGPPPTS